MNIEKFTHICRLSQKDLKSFVVAELHKTHGENVQIGDGFVYAQGVFPVMLVAHMDTVHMALPYKIECHGDALSSPNGIGGDDRCGVYMILEIVKKYNCSVLFCEDEEIGAVGAKKFTKAGIDINANYIIELDRMGKNDAVFYDCDNADFEDFICQEFFKFAYGSFSDISVLAPHFGVAAVNLSCGYYCAHTKSEYVMMTETDTVIGEVCKLLERTDEAHVFEYIPYRYTYRGDTTTETDWYNSHYDPDTLDEDGDLCFSISYYSNDYSENTEYVWANSDYEAIGKFVMYHSDIPFDFVYEVVEVGFDE